MVIFLDQFVCHIVIKTKTFRKRDLRQNFSKAVVAGIKSDSSKIVSQHCNKLVQIWGGSASTEPLSFEVYTDSFSLSTPTQQPVGFSSNTASNSSMENFAS